MQIWDLQEEGRRRSQGMGTWKLKMTSADVSKLSELNPEAAQSFMDRFGTATGRLKDHEESKVLPFASSPPQIQSPKTYDVCQSGMFQETHYMQ